MIQYLAQTDAVHLADALLNSYTLQALSEVRNRVQGGITWANRNHAGKQESRRQTRQRGAHSDQYRMGQSVHESITGQSLAINHMKHSINQYYLRLCGKQIHTVAPPGGQNYTR